MSFDAVYCVCIITLFQMYPGWSARDNYAVHKKRRKRKTKQVESKQSPTTTTGGSSEEQDTNTTNTSTSSDTNNSNDVEGIIMLTMYICLDLLTPLDPCYS